MKHSEPLWLAELLCSDEPGNEAYRLDPKKIIRELTRQKIIVVYKNKEWKNNLITGMCREDLASVSLDWNMIKIRGTGIVIQFISLYTATTARGYRPNRIFYEPLLECKYAADRLENIYKREYPPLPIHEALYAPFFFSRVIEDEVEDVHLNDLSPELDEFLNSLRRGD